MKIGLVLSGGFTKGAYQAGFLKAFEEEVGREKVSCISGASIGMLGAYGFSANKVDKVVELWRDVHFDSLADLIHSSWFHHYMKKTLNALMEKGDFLEIPMYSPIVYVPFIHHEYCKLVGEYNPKWYKFVRGAIAFPFLVGPPSFFRGQLTLDGGAIDNIPVLPLIKKEKPDVVAVIHFTSQYRPRLDFLKEGIPIVDYDITLRHKLRGHSLDFHHDTLCSMMEEGYEYGRLISSTILNKPTVEELLAAAEERKKLEADDREKTMIVDTWIYGLNRTLWPIFRHDCKNVRDLTLKKKKRKKKKEKSAEGAVLEGEQAPAGNN